MTQKNGKRDYKHAYELQKKSGETEDQLERQRARRKYVVDLFTATVYTFLVVLAPSALTFKLVFRFT